MPHALYRRRPTYALRLARHHPLPNPLISSSAHKSSPASRLPVASAPSPPSQALVDSSSSPLLHPRRPHPRFTMNPAFTAPTVPSLFLGARLTPARCHVATPRRAAAPPSRAVPRMHGPAATPETDRRRRPGEHKGFVEEMRFIAMRLHTKDQAPREGEQEASALPIDAWFPARADFMQFLIDSRAVYDYFENHLTTKEAGHPIFSRFSDTGLERLDALDKDIAYLNGLGVETPLPTVKATRYVDYMKGLVEDKPESVLCHWYNYYFAHSAGGRMIGRLMQDRLFDGRQFEFYKWESEVKEILNKVRVIIDEVAAEWPRDVKDECLKETGLAFGYSGTVLQNLAKASS